MSNILPPNGVDQTEVGECVARLKQTRRAAHVLIGVDENDRLLRSSDIMTFIRESPVDVTDFDSFGLTIERRFSLRTNRPKGGIILAYGNLQPNLTLEYGSGQKTEISWDKQEWGFNSAASDGMEHYESIDPEQVTHACDQIDPAIKIVLGSLGIDSAQIYIQ